MIRILLVLALLVAALGGCGAGAPVCPVLATRCAGSRVELCDSSGRWFTTIDCAEVALTSGGGDWACSETREDGEEINTCRPAPAPTEAP